LYRIVILTASVLRIYVTWQGTNVKLPDDDTEMSKHVGVYIIQKDTVVILTVQLLVVIKTNYALLLDNGSSPSFLAIFPRIGTKLRLFTQEPINP